MSHDCTRAIIDLDAVSSNFDAVCRKAKVPVMAVIKADAYGHGAVPIARLLENRCAFFGVSSMSEALELRADVIAFQFGVLSLEDVRRRGRFKEGFELPADIVVYVRLRGKGGTQEKPESKKQRPQHGAGEAGRCVFDGL